MFKNKILACQLNAGINQSYNLSLGVCGRIMLMEVHKPIVGMVNHGQD